MMEKEAILESMRQETAAMRMFIPKQNRPKFDVESEDYYKAMKADGEYAEYLLNLWRNRMIWLKESPDCYLAPPCLVRKAGETVSAYIERCYEIWEKI